MILNTGSRTDIPAYFSEWFRNRIREGYVCVRNPYFPQQVTKYRLDPEVVDCLVFCTKNPAPMLPYLNELDAFHQLWFVTITPYGKEIEPHVLRKEEVMNDFKKLSKKVGLNCISWRYDPIFINTDYTVEYHIETFEKMAAVLSGHVDNCVISFIDLYEKTKRNFPHVRDVSGEEQEKIGEAFSEIGRRYGIQIRTCCEGERLAKYGIETSGCMTKAIVEHAVGSELEIPKKKLAREACNCLLGNDIGVYNTCSHGCIYCYANYDRKTVEMNCRRHDKNSPFLIGSYMDGDIVKDAVQKKYSYGQLKLF